MDNTKLILPGDKMDIYMPDSSDGTEMMYKSSISDILQDNIWEITMPVQGSKMVLFQVGMQFDFVLYTKGKTIFKCSAIVRRRYRKDSLYFLAIELISNLEKIQRRQFFRLPCTLDMDFCRLSHDEDESFDETAFCNDVYAKITPSYTLKDAVHAVILDISGGGIRFSIDVSLEAGSYILTRFNLTLGGSVHDFILIGQVVDCIKVPEQHGRYFIRSKFIFDNIAKRELIVRYVFEEERRIRRREME